MQQQKKK